MEKLKKHVPVIILSLACIILFVMVLDMKMELKKTKAHNVSIRITKIEEKINKINKSLHSLWFSHTERNTTFKILFTRQNKIINAIKKSGNFNTFISLISKILLY